jgi:uncharacterized protein YceH (UPF0502 family)
MSEEEITGNVAAVRWRPLGPIERRVLGVLIEKAKTTPENYPLSLNALRAGCNQKSNRAPQMQLEEDAIEEALDNLREAGAVLLVQGESRVDRFRHLAYEWLGVDKVELAVMAELLLRGAQSVGELRGRAARMEPIKDLGELLPILAALVAKRLIVYLSPPGRGALVTHSLFLDREMEKVRRELAAGFQSIPAAEGLGPDDEPSPAKAANRPAGAARAAATTAAGPSEWAVEMRRMHEELTSVKQELRSVRAEMESTAQQLRRQFDELNRQLGN